jgi:hypothetical protein
LSRTTPPINRIRKEAGDNGETPSLNWSDGYDDGRGCDITLNPIRQKSEILIAIYYIVDVNVRFDTPQLYFVPALKFSKNAPITFLLSVHVPDNKGELKYGK